MNNSVLDKELNNTVKSDYFSPLNEIEHEGNNIVICSRNINHLQKAIDALVENEIQLRIEGDLNQIKEQLSEALLKVYSNCEELIYDIENLISHFKNVSKADSFKLMLSAVNSNMCSKFHTDINTLRLLCSYKGPGTLWISDELVNNVKNPANTNWELDFPNKIQQAQTGDVVLLKGALYPNGNAVMHKSPSIEESGATRLLLRIDTQDFLNS